MIVAQNIKKSFGNLEVLKGISFEIPAGQVTSIIGSSGAGKTTLLQIMGTLSKADSGQIFINNVDVSQLNETRLARFRNQNIGFVFQFHQLLPEFTALENVCMPAFIAGENKKRATEKAKDVLNFLKLDHRFEHKPAELSGGEQQRVAVARALINSPSIILADEPSGNLDSKNKEELHQLFFDLRDKYGQSFIIVTHDLELASLSDRTITMKDGKLSEDTLNS